MRRPLPADETQGPRRGKPLGQTRVSIRRRWGPGRHDTCPVRGRGCG